MVSKWRIFKALSDLSGATIAQNGLKVHSFYSFVHPKWPKITFVKTPF